MKKPANKKKGRVINLSDSESDADATIESESEAEEIVAPSRRNLRAKKETNYRMVVISDDDDDDDFANGDQSDPTIDEDDLLDD